MKNIHNVKSDMIPFRDVWTRRKRAEVRVDDRGYAEGDDIVMHEIADTGNGTGMTGRYVRGVITHIQRGYGLPENIAVLSFKEMGRGEAGMHQVRHAPQPASAPSRVALGIAAGSKPSLYPRELDDDLKQILGMPNFACIPYVQAFRRLGYEIKHKAEEEQAFTIDWLLRQYLKGGISQIASALEEAQATIDAMNKGDKNCVHELDMDIETGDGRALMSCSKCGYQRYVSGVTHDRYRTT
jgi:hypothetical protein